MSLALVTGWIFRFVFYVFFGFTMEVTFAATHLDRVLGLPLKRRVPRKYAEGFVTLYMIPIHGIGMLVGFEAMHAMIGNWPILARFVVWAISITATEIITGWLYDKCLGFYPWDYYAESKFRIFKRGYSLWTLVPLWGIAGIVLEWYSRFLIHLTPSVIQWFFPS